MGLEWIDSGAAASIKRKVDAAMQTPHFRLGLVIEGKLVEGDERRAVLSALFAEIRRAVGAERFDVLPVELLDQFAVMSALKNHDTHGLIASLLNSFLISYLTPETHERAFAKLEKLRGEVGTRRGRAVGAARH